MKYEFMQIGGLNDILKALLDNNYNKGISNQELTRLLQKIENDATEIYHTKYGLDDKIKFNIDCDNTTPNANLIGRQNVKSLECIRKSIRKNLDLMHENMKTIFRLYLIQCGEGNTINDT
jgi:PHP family Zn ribbon phosphoesterase